MRTSVLLHRENAGEEIRAIMKQHDVRKILLVCGRSYQSLPVKKDFDELELPIIMFSAFQPNPEAGSVEAGVQLLSEEKCNFLVAVGGGSAMDVAKCIKLSIYRRTGREIPMLAVPTTAGSGSEATKFAVIYEEGVKKSVEDELLLPNYVWLEPKVLETLPVYQRKASLLDALSHAIESCWSIRSDNASRQLATEAIRQNMKYRQGYLDNTPEGNAGMQQAAYLAGQAINRTRTTAAHAMSYKLTTRYGIAHGHAVALVLPVLWRFMLQENISDDLMNIFGEIADSMGCRTPMEAVETFENIVSEFDLERVVIREEEVDELVASVNPERLKNHPIRMTEQEIRNIYLKIGGEKQHGSTEIV